MAIQDNTQQKAKSSCLKVIVLLILFAALILSTLLTIIGYDLLKVAQNSALQKNALDEIVFESDLIYQWIQTYATQKIQDGSAQGETSIWQLVTRLSPEDWQVIQEKIITNEFEMGLVNESVSMFNQWLESDQSDLSFKVDLRTLTSDLNNEATRVAVDEIILSLPDCSQAEVNAILLQVSTSSIDQIQFERLCKLPDPLLEQQLNLFYGSLSKIEDDLPTKTEISLWQAEQGQNNRATTLTKTALKTVGFMGQWGWVIVLSLIVIILALCLPSIDDIAMWLGVPFILSGTVLLALAVAGRWLGLLGFNLPIVRGAPTLNTAINSILFDSIGYLHRPMLWQGLVLLVIGFVLFFVLLLRNIQRKSKS